MEILKYIMLVKQIRVPLLYLTSYILWCAYKGERKTKSPYTFTILIPFHPSAVKVHYTPQIKDRCDGLDTPL